MVSTTFIVACFNVILALIMVFYNWKLNKNIIFFAVYLFVVSFISVLYDTIINGGSEHMLMILIGNSGPLMMLAGPMFFFFIRALVRDDYEYSDKDLLHFVPFFINMIILVPYIFSPIEYKLDVAYSSLGNLSNYMNSYIIMFPTWACNLVKVTIIIIYILYSIYILRKGLLKKLKKLDVVARKHYLRTYRWLMFIGGFSVFMCFLHYGLILYFRFDGAEYVNLQSGSFFVISTIANSILPLSLLFNPSVLLGMPTTKVLSPADKVNMWNDNEIYNQSELGLDREIKADITYFRELSERIEIYIEKAEPYLDTDFSITILSDVFGVPVHHVQFCFKNYINKSFDRYCDEFRLQRAMSLIRNVKDMNLEVLNNISFESGFPNSVRMNKAFKSFSGMTPVQWHMANT
jgi:AraC-like DNA-binding protein